jgi:cytochrome P450
MRILGLPLTEWEKVATPFHEISWTKPGTERNDRAVEGVFGVMQMLTGEIAKRRAEPTDDLISFLVHADLEGRALTEEEILKICFLQFIGGVDTSTGLLSHAFAWLSEHPEHCPKLVHDPEYLRTATEEFLRWTSPAPALCRTVTAETQLGGQTLIEGDRMLISWASANQDARVFDNPDEVQLDRWPNRHQAFGLGAHRCLGSNLGRVQFQEVLVTALKRLPDLKVDLANAELYPTLGQVNGYTHLPATFTPTPALGRALPE